MSYSFSSNSSSDTDGAYLMSHSATTGAMPNNYRFSPCSLRLMYPVIVHKGSCLQRHRANQCGNEVVEKGEECDCGNSDVCSYNDPCCTPSDAPRRSGDFPCTVPRSRGKTCSPLSGPCCSWDCQVVRDPAAVCNEATECHGRSLCDGVSGRCPGPAAKPNGTACDGGTRFCVAGRCADSVCHRHGFMTCRCSTPAEDRCKLCCRASLGSRCLPAEALGIVGKRQRTIYLSPGEPCDDPLLAFCDENHSCVPHLGVAHSAVVKGNPVSWFLNYWPYLLAIAVAALVGFGFFNWCSFHLEDAHMRSVHYGKIMALFRIAAIVNVRIARGITISRYVFSRLEKKVAKGNQPVRYLEAVSRLRTFFPTCPLSHIVSIVMMATSEEVVVRVLLAQGFAFRRFLPKVDSENAPKTHLLPRGLADRSNVHPAEECITSMPSAISFLGLGAEGSSSFFLKESGSVLGSELSSTYHRSNSASVLRLGDIGSAASDLAEDTEFSHSCLQHFHKELSRSEEVIRAVSSSQVRERVVYGRTKSASAIGDATRGEALGTTNEDSFHVPPLKAAQLTPAVPRSWPALPTSRPQSRTTLQTARKSGSTLSKSSSGTPKLGMKLTPRPQLVKSERKAYKLKKHAQVVLIAKRLHKSVAAKREAEHLRKANTKQTEQELIRKSESSTKTEDTSSTTDSTKSGEEEAVQITVSEIQEALAEESEENQTTSLWGLLSHYWIGDSSSCEEVPADQDQLHDSPGANEALDIYLATKPEKGRDELGEVGDVQAASGLVRAGPPPGGGSASVVYTKEDGGRVLLRTQSGTSKHPRVSSRDSTAVEIGFSQGLSDSAQHPGVSRPASTLQHPGVSRPATTSQHPGASQQASTSQHPGASRHASISKRPSMARLLSAVRVARQLGERSASKRQAFPDLRQASAEPKQFSTKGDASVDKTGHEPPRTTPRTKDKPSTQQIAFASPSAALTDSAYYLDLESTVPDNVNYGMDFVDVHMDKTQLQPPSRAHRLGNISNRWKALSRAAIVLSSSPRQSPVLMDKTPPPRPHRLGNRPSRWKALSRAAIALGSRPGQSPRGGRPI